MQTSMDIYSNFCASSMLNLHKNSTYLDNLFACVLVPFRKNVVGHFVHYTKTLYRFAIWQFHGQILNNKDNIPTQEANLVVFNLHFYFKSSLLYIMLMFKYSRKVQTLFYSPKLSAYTQNHSGKFIYYSH